MQKLPHGLADPLHLQEPVLFKALVASALVLVVLLLLWRWWRKRVSRRAQDPPPPPQTVPGPPPIGGIQAALEAIWRSYREKLDYRGGCHELSRVLRAHFEKRVGEPLTHLTAREIRRSVGDTALTQLFKFLADLQFGRRAPERAQFDHIYKMARAVSISSSEDAT